MTVKITVLDSKIEVKTPYHPDFPSAAKNLGGRPEKENGVWTWYFDPRDEASVRDLCRDLFGTDGTDDPALVTLRVTLEGERGQDVWLAGRKIAWRPGRDSPVRLGHSVVLVGGRFSRTGGSAKYPALQDAGNDHVVLEVRDVPESLARREAEEPNVEIVSELPPKPVTVTLDPGATEHLSALESETGLSASEIVAAALAAYREEIEL